MYLKQLSVFLENREGRLEEVLDILAEAGINIISLSLADTSDYGMLRLLVSDPRKGKEVLRAKGVSATLTDIITVRLQNEVGTLQELLTPLYKAGVNIEYMYAFSSGADHAVIAMKPSDVEKTREVLTEAGVKLLQGEEFSSLY